MSKAFTKEEDAAPPLERPVPRVLPGERRYVTEEGHRALKDELARTPPRTPRAAALATLVDALTVVRASDGDEERVLFGAWVTVEDEEGTQATFRIVGPDEVDAKAGLISVESPLARALLGKREGETVEVHRPRGDADYTIVAIRYRAH